MRKLFYLGFCLVLVSSVGCVLTNYELITDNDQVANGQGTGVVNTNGKAHIRESSQIATIWPEGTEELIWFVDQKSNGDRTLTTYNNFSTGVDPIFHDDLYCSPEWQGCAVLTALDPQVGDDPYDYTINWHCEGARSLSGLVNTTRYYGECGRARMPLADRVALLNMGAVGTAFGREGLFYSLDPSNVTVTLDNGAGLVRTLPITGEARAFVSFGGTRVGALDLTHPLLGSVGRSYADFLATDATRSTTVTLTYNGISVSQRMAGAVGPSSPERVLANVNRHY